MSLELHKQLDRLEMMCDQIVSHPLDYQNLKDQINVIRNGIITLQLESTQHASYNAVHRSLANV